MFYYAICMLTLCILMDFPMHVDTIRMGLLSMYFKGRQNICCGYSKEPSHKFSRANVSATCK